MLTVQNPHHEAIASRDGQLFPQSESAASRQPGASLRRTARVAGAAYLVQYATSVYAIYVRSTLVVNSDAARSASNILAHPQLFRVGIVADVLTCACLVVLNVAFYELLAPVHRSLARMAALWRVVEVSIGGAIAVSSFVALSILSGATYAQAFQPREVQALARVFIQAQSSGYMVALFFSGLGSATYMYLLLKSRYVPTWLAVLALAGSIFVAVFAVVPLVFPAAPALTTALVTNLPVGFKLALGVLLAPIIAFEAILGLWLLLKGVRAADGQRE